MSSLRVQSECYSTRGGPVRPTDPVTWRAACSVKFSARVVVYAQTYCGYYQIQILRHFSYYPKDAQTPTIVFVVLIQDF